MNASPDPVGPAPEDPGALAEMICFDLYAASRAVTACYRPLLDELGLTYPQYLVLVALWEGGEHTVRDLIAALRLDYGTVSPLLKRLEARGLVDRRRRADDERAVLVSLTEEGRALQQRARHVPAAIRDALGLDAAETAALQQVLRRIARTAGPA